MASPRIVAAIPAPLFLGSFFYQVRGVDYHVNDALVKFLGKRVRQVETKLKIEGYCNSGTLSIAIDYGTLISARVFSAMVDRRSRLLLTSRARFLQRLNNEEKQKPKMVPGACNGIVSYL